MLRRLAFALFLVRAASAQAPPPPVMETVSVSGEGVVAAAPDRALVRLGVQTRAPSAVAALRAHEEDVARVLTRVRRFGIADRAIQIEGLSLGEFYGPNGPDGYVAQRVVTVTTDSLRRVPDLVAAVVAEGANQLQGLEYVVRDTRPAEALALDAAVADARRKAEQIASASGIRLGRVVAVQELDPAAFAPSPYGRVTARSASEGEPAAYSSGVSQVRARVLVLFEIDN